MDEKLLAELANIKSGLETKTALEVKNAIEAFEAKLPTAIKSAFEVEVKAVKDELEAKFTADLKVVQDHADKLDVKLQEKSTEVEPVDVLAKAIKDNIEAIKNVKVGAGFQTKAVANMTTANLTGTKPRNYNFDIVTLPA